MDFLCRVINRSILHEKDIDGYGTYVVKHAPFIISKLTEFYSGTYMLFFFFSISRNCTRMVGRKQIFRAQCQHFGKEFIKMGALLIEE